MQLDTIKAMERIARSDISVISLGQGIPSGNLDPALQVAAVEAMQAGYTDAYSDPQGILELRQAIVLSTAEEKLGYSEDEIIVTVGAIEAINVALRGAITASRKKVIIPTPAYSAYFSLVTQLGGQVVPLLLNENAGWTIPIEQLKTHITDDVAAILICNPNNPTGTIHDQATLDAVASLAQDAGIPLILDEVYRHITYDDTFYSPAENEDYRDTIIRVMSFSKDFNMTGWRVGYIQAARQRIPELTAIHDSLVNCTPVVSQYVALKALQESKRIYDSNRKEYSKRRSQMHSWLERVEGVTQYDAPAGGYFFFPRLVAGVSSHDAALAFAKHGLVTIPGSAFGAGGEGHIRLCFGRSPQAIGIGMERLVQYFESKVVG